MQGTDFLPMHHTVGGSIDLYTVRTDRFKTARFSLFMTERAGEDSSPLGTLLMGVLQRGCCGYPSLLSINQRLDHLYGTALSLRNFLQGDCHVIGFTADMLDAAFLPRGEEEDILAGTLDMIGRMWLRPLLDDHGGFRADIVESEKQNLCDCILADRKDARTYSLNRMRRLQCDGEPYGLSLAGRVEQVRALTAEDVTREWHRRLSESCANAFYVGSADPQCIQNTWHACFADWKPRRAAVPVTQPHKKPEGPCFVDENLPVSQGRLNISWHSDVATLNRATDRRLYDAAMVLAELFGVMQGNLLFANVRERLGLCYECDVIWESTKGIFTVTMGISPRCRALAEAEVVRLMQAIQDGYLDETLVELAKTSLSNGYRQIGDNPGAIEAFWLRRLMWADATSLREDDPAACALRIQQVTREDVIRVARMLTPDMVYFLNGTEGEDEGGVSVCR